MERYQDMNDDLCGHWRFMISIMVSARRLGVALHLNGWGGLDQAWNDAARGMGMDYI
jgi:hypothetical protein